jgi:hypothetical protein
MPHALCPPVMRCTRRTAASPELSTCYVKDHIEGARPAPLAGVTWATRARDVAPLGSSSEAEARAEGSLHATSWKEVGVGLCWIGGCSRYTPYSPALRRPRYDSEREAAKWSTDVRRHARDGLDATMDATAHGKVNARLVVYRRAVGRVAPDEYTASGSGVVALRRVGSGRWSTSK